MPLLHLCQDTAPSHACLHECGGGGRDGLCRGQTRLQGSIVHAGEKPEARYQAARAWLDEAGFESTLHYVAHVAAAVRDRTGLLPHINAGCMTAAEMAMLRPVSASMGLMLESATERLCAAADRTLVPPTSGLPCGWRRSQKLAGSVCLLRPAS